MGREENVRKVSFHMLLRVVECVANGMNDDVYVGVRCHATWVDHVEEVNVDENSSVSCCMKRRGAGDWHGKRIAGRREEGIE
jgi:hypothetical protein